MIVCVELSTAVPVEVVSSRTGRHLLQRVTTVMARTVHEVGAYKVIVEDSLAGAPARLLGG